MYPSQPPTAAFTSVFFPQQVALITVGDNMLPMGYWTVVSKEPFRVLLLMGVGNHSLGLLKKHKEAAMHFMPWSDRERVVRAGYISGRNVNKAETLGFTLLPAEKLKATKLVAGAEGILELVVNRELLNISREFAPFIMDVVAVHGDIGPEQRHPILFLSQESFATLGERWEYKK
ncbi:MAG: flavin reductase [Anaerolineales bacterium]|jgi:flavin reductase (DIM6/NTAB) family NADH-FMN oxidoreductase RutF|nr:flavin reductase [Anaerolineales bacterium]